MASQALTAFKIGLAEIADLRTIARPSLARADGATLRLARVAGRAQVVLLSGHFERYLYAVNEEAVQFVNSQGVQSERIPGHFKVLHSRDPVDRLAETAWERRTDQLESFIRDDGWLWSPGGTGTLSHDRLLTWLRAPKPSDLLRYYRYWEIDDIFTRITRSQSARGKLWFSVQEFVDMRNNIAHGDFTAQPTQSDVSRYMSTARVFCERADSRLSNMLARLTEAPRPW